VTLRLARLEWSFSQRIQLLCGPGVLVWGETFPACSHITGGAELFAFQFGHNTNKLHPHANEQSARQTGPRVQRDTVQEERGRDKTGLGGNLCLPACVKVCLCMHMFCGGSFTVSWWDGPKLFLHLIHSFLFEFFSPSIPQPTSTPSTLPPPHTQNPPLTVREASAIQGIRKQGAEGRKGGRGGGRETEKETEGRKTQNLLTRGIT